MMKNINQVCDRAFMLVDKYCSTDATHNRDHVKRVLKLAEYLAKKENSKSKPDLESLRLAAIMHDLGSGYQIRELKKSNDKFISGKHAEHSLKIAEQFLKKEGFTKKQIEKIQKIIASHGTHGEKEMPEGDFLHDADLLDGIGMVGVLRKFTYGGQIGRNILGSLEFTKEKIKNRKFRTKVGQKIGAERIKKVKAWLNDVEKELNTKDLN